MTDKIKELSDKCGLAWTLKTEQDVKNLVEFVELIVRECAGVAWGIYANQEIANGIKQHFGVE